jgi:hypothetical protein
VTVLLGNGKDSIIRGATFSVGNSPVSVVTGYFNQDINLDLAIVNFVENTVSVLYGNGIDNIISSTKFLTPPSPISIAIGDFNGDNNLGFVVANFKNDTITIFANTCQ